MKKQSVLKIVESCVLLVIGILFCVSLAMGESVLSIILGASLIGAGTVIVIISIINEKSVSNPMSLGGLFALAIGIFFIASNAIGFIFQVVPFLLLVFGSALIVEAFLSYYARNEKIKAIFIIKIIVGIALVVVGILLLTVADFKKYVALIIGIALIFIAIDNIALEFVKVSK